MKGWGGVEWGVAFHNKAILSAPLYQFLPLRRVFTLFVLPVHTAHTVLTSVVVMLKYNIKPLIWQRQYISAIRRGFITEQVKVAVPV